MVNTTGLVSMINAIFGKLKNCKESGNIMIPFNGHPINATVVECKLVPNTKSANETDATFVVSQEYGIILFTTHIAYNPKYGKGGVSITVEPIDIVIRK